MTRHGATRKHPSRPLIRRVFVFSTLITIIHIPRDLKYPRPGSGAKPRPAEPSQHTLFNDAIQPHKYSAVNNRGFSLSAHVDPSCVGNGYSSLGIKCFAFAYCSHGSVCLPQCSPSTLLEFRFMPPISRADVLKPSRSRRCWHCEADTHSHI